MPRTTNSKNYSKYHYKVDLWDNDQDVLIETRFFKTQQDVIAKYNINRSAIYFLIKPVQSRNQKKHKNLKIFKLDPPIDCLIEKYEDGLYVPPVAPEVAN
jgi:hypothetical protein